MEAELQAPSLLPEGQRRPAPGPWSNIDRRMQSFRFDPLSLKGIRYQRLLPAPVVIGIEMLQLAGATASEMGARRLCPSLPFLQQFQRAGAKCAAFLSLQAQPHTLARQR